jgi:ubiquinone/menaquinone biosynthesis C-methylase UbiE
LEKRITKLPTPHVPVTVAAVGLEQLDAKQRYDTIVCNLVLCSVPDLDQALKHIYDLLENDGQLLFIEHVAAPQGTWRAWVQKLVQPVWGAVGDGCQLQRETGEKIRKLGFATVEVTEFEQEMRGVVGMLAWLAGSHAMGRVAGKVAN